MNEPEQLFLCKPCAEEMKNMKLIESVEYVQSATKKDNCELCRRRRFGYICKVKYRSPLKRKEENQ